MQYDTFEAMLGAVGLSKKEFAELVKMNYTSVTNWKQSDNVPEWVESWLINYDKARKFDNAVGLVNNLVDIVKKP
ncbi:hypothetical protein [uncultured Campylobacter sp.]|jgi:conserved domain protein|uniref:hypothetical protein n=1 Tax=uncultured Campylobacter sp. TaxID=218934 RepID=UPI003211BE2A